MDFHLQNVEWRICIWIVPLVHLNILYCISLFGASYRKDVRFNNTTNEERALIDAKLSLLMLTGRCTIVRRRKTRETGETEAVALSRCSH